MKDSVLSQLAALKGAPTPVLKAKWRELFETEPPAYNRRLLAYRIQELAYGGLSRETLERLRAMAKQYATRDAAERKARPLQRPIAGTKLIREYQGIEHCVTVRADDFEYMGRPYKSLSSIAREITGTKWNGLVFFGLKRHPGQAVAGWDLHPLESAALSRRTPTADIGKQRPGSIGCPFLTRRLAAKC